MINNKSLIIDINNQGCSPQQIKVLTHALKHHVEAYKSKSHEVDFNKTIISPFDFNIRCLYLKKNAQVWCATFQAPGEKTLRVVIGLKIQ